MYRRKMQIDILVFFIGLNHVDSGYHFSFYGTSSQ